jgi:hypothetical protein
MGTMGTIGIWLSTESSRRTRTTRLSSRGLRILACGMGSVKEVRRVVVVVGNEGQTCTIFLDMANYIDNILISRTPTLVK